jgi:Mn-dependent DtxR family transcriptional regulator
MEKKGFLNANDVATIMDISVPMAYKIIRRLNNELTDQGFITIAGRISRAYFESKVYGIEVA